MSITLEYIAGLFDGEGSVTLTKRTARDTNFIALTLCNTHREVINDIQEMFGKGSIHKSPGVNMPVYNWYVSHASASYCGQLLLPYLRIKKEEVRLALEWAEQQQSIGRQARAFFRWDKDKYSLLKEEGYTLADKYIQQIKKVRKECRL